MQIPCACISSPSGPTQLAPTSQGPVPQQASHPPSPAYWWHHNAMVSPSSRDLGHLCDLQHLLTCPEQPLRLRRRLPAHGILLHPDLLHRLRHLRRLDSRPGHKVDSSLTHHGIGGLNTLQVLWLGHSEGIAGPEDQACQQAQPRGKDSGRHGTGNRDGANRPAHCGNCSLGRLHHWQSQPPWSMMEWCRGATRQTEDRRRRQE
mmetsp:Transcript_70949/g.178927  ORF Transcript_70949/g.178927 Transcript_70949/m.178927 type:complete len:204 (-) Transcript_70949:73-684(-)